MGQGYSDWGPKPLYTRNPDPNGDAPYDWWGYIPDNFTPSQHVWHTYFHDPDAKIAMNFPIPDDPRSKNLQYGIVSSLPEMILKGRYPTTDQPIQPKGPRFASDVFPGANYFGDHVSGVIKAPDSTAWTERWMRENNPDEPKQGGLEICTPLNFPYCTMEPIKEGAGISKDFAGRIQDSMQLWEQTIDDLYDKFYVHGNVEGLNKINSDDTSDFDPCAQPGLLARLAPLVLGFLTGGAFQKLFAPDMRNTYTSQTMMAWSLGSAAFGFFFMRGAMDVYGPQQTNLWYAAISLAGPAGLTIGEYFINKGTLNLSNNTLYATGCVLSYFFLLPAINRIITLPAPLNFIVRLVGSLIYFVGYFLCMITNPEFDACAATDQNGYKLFADARRWDAASIAAMLTEEVRSEEGWERDDPRSEFAYKAFLTGPAMVDAARGKRSGKMPMWTHNTGNPVGSIYAPQALQSTVDGLTFASGPMYGWDGGEKDLWFNVADANSYACQNWEAMRGIGVPPRKSNPEQLTLYRTFNEWVKAVRDAANVPANLRHAGIGQDTSGIPGWKSGKDTMYPLTPHLSNEQAMELVNLAYDAADVEARYKVVANYESTYMGPPNANIDRWLRANQSVYTYLFLKEGKTADDVWVFLQGMVQGAELSAYIFAVTATSNLPLWEFWDKSPAAMKDAARIFSPPPAGVPFGLTGFPVAPPIKLPPPVTHGHPSIPLGPVADPNSACAINIANLRNAPSNLQNNSIANWLNIFDSLINAPSSCKTCSQPHLNIAFGYKLAFEAARTPAVQNNYPGIGSVLAFLQSLKWSDRSMAALVQELMTPIANQQEVNEWMGPGQPFWNRSTWDGNNYAPLLATLLALDGYFDESSNICEHLGSLTPLPPVHHIPGPQPIWWPEEPPDLKHVWHVDKQLPGVPQPIYWPTPPPELKHLQDTPFPPGTGFDPLRPNQHIPGPQPIWWPEEPPDLKHLWHRDKTFPGVPEPIYWPTAPPDFKHFTDRPFSPGTGFEPLKPNQTMPAPLHLNLIPLHYDFDPLKPNQTIPGPEHLQMIPMGDACWEAVDGIRNPRGRTQYMNMPLTAYNALWNNARSQDACSTCNRTTYYELCAYAGVIAMAFPAQGSGIKNVGDFIYVTNVVGGWSNNVSSAFLHTLHAPLTDQAPLSDWLAQFFSSTVCTYNGLDYIAQYNLLMALPGEWDSTFPEWCN